MKKRALCLLFVLMLMPPPTALAANNCQSFTLSVPGSVHPNGTRSRIMQYRVYLFCYTFWEKFTHPLIELIPEKTKWRRQQRHTKNGVTL